MTPISGFKRVLLAGALTITSTSQVLTVEIPLTLPSKVAMSAQRLAQMDPVIEDAIAKHQLPGAVVLVARKGRVAWRKAYGERTIEPRHEAMTPDTIFDLA